MRRQAHDSRGFLFAAVVLVGLGALVLAGSQPAWTDDKDLLKTRFGKPYLFIQFDISDSMALGFDDSIMPASGDDPDSKIYQAKEIIYDIFKDVDDVQFGFATSNQDSLRVRSKHFIHAVQTAPSGLPLAWPAANEELIFGPHFPANTKGNAGAVTVPAVGTLGSCAAPMDLGNATQKLLVERFPKLPVLVDTNGDEMADELDTNSPTILWLKSGATTYKVTFSRVPSAVNPNIGQNGMEIVETVEPVLTCPTLGAPVISTVTLRFERGFFMHEHSHFNAETAPNDSVDDEGLKGYWTWSDTQVNSAVCPDHPHSGQGWEGNYDGSFNAASSFSDPGGPFDPITGNCPNPFNPASCVNLKEVTTPSSLSTLLDKGDLLPFDWSATNKADLLSRMAPDYLDGSPDFGAADFFHDLPDSTTGYLDLKNTSRKPLMPRDRSPIGNMVNDFRCWYQGEGNKCKSAEPFPPGGWEKLACENDPDWGCRKSYQVIISDKGEDTCKSASACSETANLNNKAKVQTWVIGLGIDGGTSEKDCEKAMEPNFACLAKNGKGHALCANTSNQLRDDLLGILGQIREEARSFASAAVPTVQATVSDKIFVSNFTPLQDESVWDGHLNAFLKPLPLDVNGKPDTAKLCSAQPSGSQGSECFVWDAGEQMETQVDPATPNGLGPDKRRVFYSQLETQGTWTNERRSFDNTSTSDTDALEFDFWDGLGIGFIPGDIPSEDSARARAGTALTTTYTLKSATINTPTGAVNVDYILGDIFHSNPLIIGNPNNVGYFAADVGGDPLITDCATDTQSYRCFALRQANRRKLLVVGANDGMLHAFDAGMAFISDKDESVDPPAAGAPDHVAFNNGTGKEVFAYVPRAVMPTLRQLTEGTLQQYSVDGSVQAADVLIDPVNDGVAFGGSAPASPPDPDQRQWRTVLVGGFREGGRGYYALDVTQPDVLGTESGFANMPPQPITTYVPGCIGGLPDASPTCLAPSPLDSVPYPAALWEFYDAGFGSNGIMARDSDRAPILLDEDNNSRADLGFSWSIPNLGRIRVCSVGGTACTPNPTDPADDDDLVDVYVAVFGGGLPSGPDVSLSDKTSQNPPSGNWIYMVDVETGQVIYKKKVLGAVPSEPAAVDTNQDGYLDRIYFGTTAGFLYRADIGVGKAGADGLLSNGNLPNLVDRGDLHGLDGQPHAGERIQTLDPNGITEVWKPKLIFNANVDSIDGRTLPVRPFYYRPSIIFVAKAGRYAIGIGTGDREDLWQRDPLGTDPQTFRQGRFYTFMDDSDQVGVTLPMSESAMRLINIADPNAAAGIDFLTDTSRPIGGRGWFVVLGQKERVITNDFALAGITFFSTFEPDTTELGSCSDQVSECTRAGTSRSFVMLTTNGNGVLPLTSTTTTRFLQHNTFVTEPFDEPGQTKNPNAGSGGTNADQLTAAQRQVMQSLQALFPRNCRFANRRIDIKTIAGDTGVIFIAPVPICVVEKNWKEF